MGDSPGRDREGSADAFDARDDLAGVSDHLVGIGGEQGLDPAAAEAALAAGEDVLHPHDAATEQRVVAQMNAMFQRDRWMALAFVVVLLVTLPFITIALWDVMPSTGTKVVLVLSAGVLATYNVASMLKLVQNYARDRDFIYRRDVAHLHEIRAARRVRGGGTR